MTTFQNQRGKTIRNLKAKFFRTLKKNALENGKNHIITSEIEHKAILDPAKEMELQGFKVSYVKPNKDVNSLNILEGNLSRGNLNKIKIPVFE